MGADAAFKSAAFGYEPNELSHTLICRMVDVEGLAPPMWG